MIKNSQQKRNRGELPQLDKEHLQNPSTNIILNGEKFEAFPLISATRQGCSLSPFLLNAMLEIPPNIIRHEKFFRLGKKN